MPEKLRGVVERVTYANPETGYSVVRLAVKGKLDLVTVVGELADVNAGESLELEGEWTRHQQYGRQFQVLGYRTVLPATAEGIEKYLGSGLVKGIGPVMAGRIVHKYGVDTLDVIEHEPRRLLDVLGIGPTRVARIEQAWAEQKQIREVMIFLQGHNVRASWAVKIYKAFGDQSVQVVQEDPYRLAREIRGIGFKTADQIARNMGLPADSPRRVAAGVAYALERKGGRGARLRAAGRVGGHGGRDARGAGRVDVAGHSDPGRGGADPARGDPVSDGRAAARRAARGGAVRERQARLCGLLAALLLWRGGRCRALAADARPSGRAGWRRCAA